MVHQQTRAGRRAQTDAGHTRLVGRTVDGGVAVRRRQTDGAATTRGQRAGWWAGGGAWQVLTLDIPCYGSDIGYFKRQFTAWALFGKRQTVYEGRGEIRSKTSVANLFCFVLGRGGREVGRSGKSNRPWYQALQTSKFLTNYLRGWVARGLVSSKKILTLVARLVLVS